jgi:tRNA (Thr-GGU) A37 N-methylase
VDYSFNVIGIIHSCFKEKFTIPRQPGLVKQAKATLELLAPYNRIEAVRGLEEFSHIWITFVFHKTTRDKSEGNTQDTTQDSKIDSKQGHQKSGWKPTVRPPRLGGKERVGVFASRSPFRPNPIGLSAVKLDAIEIGKGGVELHLSGVDFLNKTPVLDIKPYIGYADEIQGSLGSFADKKPEVVHEVIFSEPADEYCKSRCEDRPELKEMIIQVLETDPRPAFYGNHESSLADREFGVYILDFELKWIVQNDQILVTSLNQTT